MRLFPQDLDDDPLLALAVALRVKHLLPGPQVERALGDREHRLVVDEGAFQVGVPVVFAGCVMLVVLTKRCEPFQQLPEILPQSLFVIIDPDARRDVHGRDEAEAFLHSACLHELLNRVGDVDEIASRLCVKPEIFRERLHASAFLLPASSWVSSRGRPKLTSSFTSSHSSTRVAPSRWREATTSCTRCSGAEAPEVTPTHRTPSNHLGSISFA